MGERIVWIDSSNMLNGGFGNDFKYNIGNVCPSNINKLNVELLNAFIPKNIGTTGGYDVGEI